MKSFSVAQYYVTTFVVGFSLMTIEIISSRIVAPIIGASIFTWTSVIGITLLGLSIGNFVGGELADRYIKRYGQRVLSIALLVTAVLVYLVVPLSKHTSSILSTSSSILTVSVLVCLALFFLPSMALGALSPIIFKLYVGDTQDLGKKYGLFSSLWSLGSIAGVFITGFYFISTIGSSTTVYVIVLTLLFLFYFFHIRAFDRNSVYFKNDLIFIAILSMGLLIAFLFSYGKGSVATPSKILFQKETGYYNIKVIDYDLYPQYGHNRILFLDLDAHSVQAERPSKEFYTDISPAFSAFSDKLQNLYVIGAGAYTLPINLRKYYPNSRISVSEIDPELEKVGRTYFNLDAYNIQTEVGDARMKFSIARGDGSMEKYDLIFGDAYNSFISVPWHLLTKEFISDTENRLNPDGIYAINFIGSLEGPQSEMFESVYSTLKKVFPNNYIFAFGSNPKDIQNITILGIKNGTRLSYSELEKRLNAIDTTHFLSRILVNKNDLNEGTGIKEGLILTDDFSPIEHMMIELMNEYFPKYLPVYRDILG